MSMYDYKFSVRDNVGKKLKMGILFLSVCSNILSSQRTPLQGSSSEDA